MRARAPPCAAVPAVAGRSRTLPGSASRLAGLPAANRRAPAPSHRVAVICAAVRLEDLAAEPAGRDAGQPAQPLSSPSSTARDSLDGPVKTFQLLSGAARLVVGTDGSLALFRDDAAAPALLARVVIPWFVARTGAASAVAEPGTDGGLLELHWGDSARLRVTSSDNAQEPRLGWGEGLSDSFLLQFSVRPRGGKAHLRDMAELAVSLDSGGEWYGGGHLMRQHWPLNEAAWEVGPHYPFDNGPNGLNTLVGHHWVTSGGALVMVDPETPYLHVGLNSPPPRRNWFFGGLEKISWGVGIQNFTRQILPLSASERRGDGQLRLQARSTFESRRIDHPLSSWVAPGAADGTASPLEWLEGVSRPRRVATAAAAAAPRPRPPLPEPLSLAASLAAADAVPSAEGGLAAADGEGALLHDFAHAQDADASAVFRESGVALPLAASRSRRSVRDGNGNGHVNGNGNGDGHAAAAADGFNLWEGEEGEWLTVSARLCAAPDVRSATRAALSTLPRPPAAPLPGLLRAPIWTTWARYKSSVTQRDVEKFAAEIVERSLPRSVLEIDDRWQAAYGDTAFDTAKFPDAAGMVARLHEQGFLVTLWVMPFVEESSACYAEGAARGFFVRSNVSAGLGLKPGFFRWWNSAPVVGLDVTNPEACEWFVGRLKALQEATGVDGFKFDAGEPCFLPASFRTHRPLTHPSEYTRAWVVNVASRFQVAEVRTGHGSTAVPLLTRMGDRFSEWGEDNGLASLVPTLLTSSVLGYPFCLPDMIGGNAYFGRSPSAELMVRWAQTSALMPALQFSIAPWDLGAEADALVRASLVQRQPLIELIVQLSERAVDGLEPICRPMWWLAPLDEQTFRISDQFALGDDIIVAPVVTKGALDRDVYLTDGLWEDAALPGVRHQGPRWLRAYPAPLDALPIFHRV